MSNLDEDRPTNRLANETSAYLRQHRFNPVDWRPWGDEALARAAAEDKPILLSVGYSACHWCHVMERESFEDPETAALMNALYVCIKVDREERPDVDQLYMDVLLRMQGHGGWPMTVFCRPDGSPFHAGTYFPPRARGGMPSFQEVLRAAEEAYRARRADVDRAVGAVIESLSERPAPAAPPGRDAVVAAARAVLETADPEHGGSKGAPKFPTPTQYELLLASIELLPARLAQDALAHCRRSCREMARSGLFDHLGGGFHRYCVDARWEIPHFEKMLYDQGLLLGVFAETWRCSGLDAPPDDDFAWPLRETIALLERELTAPEGGFFASQDADSEGEEGRFYVWTPAEIEAALGDRASDFMQAYGVTPEGNFDGATTHLNDRARRPRTEFADERETLRRARARRVAPDTDTKRVAAWNGYAVAGLARAATMLDDASALASAVRAADFVLDRMRDDRGRLLRVFDGGRAHVLAFLDDHAALIDASLALFRAGAGDRFLGAARALARDTLARFYDASERDFFYTPNDGETLVHRPRSDRDGSTPAAAGLAALGFLRVAELCGDTPLRDAAHAVLATHAGAAERVPHAWVTLLRAAALEARGLRVAVVVGEGDDALALARCARRRLAADDAVVLAAPGTAPGALDPTWLAGRAPHAGRASVTVCRGTICSAPVYHVEDLVRTIRDGPVTAADE